MRGNSAYYLQGERWHRELHALDYDSLRTLALPRAGFRPRRMWLNFCNQTAYYPADAGVTDLDKAWGQAVEQNGWWDRINGARICQNEGIHTYVVDGRIRAGYQWLAAHAHVYAQGRAGLPDIHWDWTGRRPQFPNLGQHDSPDFQRYADEWMNALPAGDSINAFGCYFAPETCTARTRKFEMHPTNVNDWGTRYDGTPIAWRDWVFGRADWSRGIKGYTRSGVAIDWDILMPLRMVKEGHLIYTTWTQEKQESFAARCMGTALLFDNVTIMPHPSQPCSTDEHPWYRTPLWYAACDWPRRLGEPMLPMGQWRDGTWRRQYHGGTVIVGREGEFAKVVWR